MSGGEALNAQTVMMVLNARWVKCKIGGHHRR